MFCIDTSTSMGKMDPGKTQVCIIQTSSLNCLRALAQTPALLCVPPDSAGGGG
jgi:hypothetical protein